MPIIKRSGAPLKLRCDWENKTPIIVFSEFLNVSGHGKSMPSRFRFVFRKKRKFGMDILAEKADITPASRPCTYLYFLHKHVPM